MGEGKDEVTLYADGACAGNPGPGGWGVVLVCRGRRKELAGRHRERTTNNRMEVAAVIEGLRALKRPCVVTVLSDSQYAVNGASGSWAVSTNLDLWRQLREAEGPHEVSYRWVRGHSGQTEQERAHELAEAMARGGAS